MCQKLLIQQFMTEFWQFFFILDWQFSDTFMKYDTFLIHFWFSSDTFLTEFCIWQFSDRYLTHFRQFSDTFLQLTVFWQFSDTFLTHFWNWWDQHSIRVPKFVRYVAWISSQYETRATYGSNQWAEVVSTFPSILLVTSDFIAAPKFAMHLRKQSPESCRDSDQLASCMRVFVWTKCLSRLDSDWRLKRVSRHVSREGCGSEPRTSMDYWKFVKP